MRDDLGARELAWVSELVYERSGIQLGVAKRELVRARLAKRLRARGESSMRDYVHWLAKTRDPVEIMALVDAMSTNFTYFFREPHHFDVLRTRVLPPLFERGRGIAIWSAAASSGQEAYSIGIEVSEAREKARRTLTTTLFGTDISRRALDRARLAVYPLQELERMPRERVRRWFERGVDKFEGYARVSRSITGMARFEHLNLLSDPLPSTRFEVIFLRNVMIYFDAETRQRLVDRIVGRLAPGGWLFIGSSETLSEVVTSLELVSPSIYRLPGGD